MRNDPRVIKHTRVSSWTCFYMLMLFCLSITVDLRSSIVLSLPLKWGCECERSRAVQFSKFICLSLVFHTVAHILPKQRFPNIVCSDEAVGWLIMYLSDRRCEKCKSSVQTGFPKFLYYFHYCFLLNNNNLDVNAPTEACKRSYSVDFVTAQGKKLHFKTYKYLGVWLDKYLF